MNHELLLFFWSFCVGVCLLLCYDCIRILRKVIPHSQLSVTVTDLLYWVGSSIYIFAVMYQKNDGIIRSYAVLGILAGMLLFHFTISPYFVAVTVRIINLPVNLVKKILKRLLFVEKRGKILLCRLWRKYVPPMRFPHRRFRNKRAGNSGKRKRNQKSQDE